MARGSRDSMLVPPAALRETPRLAVERQDAMTATTRRTLYAVAAVLAGAASLARAAAAPAVAYPDGYRHWTHVSSTFIGPDAPPGAMSELGVHHVYANDLAVEGLRTGRYADGARFVYDLVAAHTANGVTKEGARLRLDVMEKDAAAHPATGGWGFESFVKGDRDAGRVGARAATMCWGCHAQRTTQGVFSVYEEAAARPGSSPAPRS